MQCVDSWDQTRCLMFEQDTEEGLLLGLGECWVTLGEWCDKSCTVLIVSDRGVIEKHYSLNTERRAKVLCAEKAGTFVQVIIIMAHISTVQQVYFVSALFIWIFVIATDWLFSEMDKKGIYNIFQGNLYTWRTMWCMKCHTLKMSNKMFNFWLQKLPILWRLPLLHAWFSSWQDACPPCCRITSSRRTLMFLTTLWHSFSVNPLKRVMVAAHGCITISSFLRQTFSLRQPHKKKTAGVNIRALWRPHWTALIIFSLSMGHHKKPKMFVQENNICCMRTNAILHEPLCLHW